jgi:hypothetical protein
MSAGLRAAISGDSAAPISVGSGVALAAALAILLEADFEAHLWQSILATLQARLLWSERARPQWEPD